MRHAYILVYSNKWTKEQVRTYIDSLREVLNWRTELPNSFYLVSEKTADELSTLFREFTKDEGLFLIAEITSNKQGWLDKKSWNMINKKHTPNEE